MKKLYLHPEFEVEEMYANWDIVTMSGDSYVDGDDLESGDLG